MNKKSIFLLSAASLMLLSSCSKLGALSADNFTVTPNPLETQQGTVPATINGHSRHHKVKPTMNHGLRDIKVYKH